MLRRLIGYEQKTFWRKPASVVFTFLFPVVMLLFFGSTLGGRSGGGGAPFQQFLVPGMAAFAVQGACFNDLAIGVVMRRQTGLLKRLRLTPVPGWATLAGTVLSAALVGCLLAATAVLAGVVLLDLSLPRHAALIVPVVLAGIVCFTALGLAAAALLGGAEAGAPVITISYLAMNFLSGTFVPVDSSSVIGKVSEFLPTRHFLRGAVAPFLPELHAFEVWRSVGLLLLWGAGAGLLAARMFRWTPKRV